MVVLTFLLGKNSLKSISDSIGYIWTNAIDKFKFGIFDVRPLFQQSKNIPLKLVAMIE